VLEELGLEVDLCHLNEGHAAFAVLARAYSFMCRTKVPFGVALSATRPGNIFTTHTPVEAGFDRFSADLIRPYVDILSQLMHVPLHELLALGRNDPDNADEPFNMAYLAMRGCGVVNAVSELHGAVSRQIFQPLYPRWPQEEIPIGHVTNGVHVPSWDSQQADQLWTRACGKERWLGKLDELCSSIQQLPNGELWSFRASQRLALIRYARQRLMRQMRERGALPEHIQEAAHILDPNAITLGFARRFAEYKRPNLLLHDPDRLARILTHPERPAQLIVAGKAHPQDEGGKHLVAAWTRFAARPDVWDRVVFLEDYDMALAQRLVAGIDVWLNTPRRPWEACGTSGMKVLANGGLNCSELDGWWAEAYDPQVGWALGDGRQHPEREYDAVEATQLYEALEQRVVPEFYDRDHAGIPQKWLTRIRSSMAHLTPQFSSNRMVREYVEKLYDPASASLTRRLRDGAKLAMELEEWHRRVKEGWGRIRFGDVRATSRDGRWFFEVQVYLGDLKSDQVRVELYADPLHDNDAPMRITLCQGEAILGAVNGFVFYGECASDRPAHDVTPRVVPFHAEAKVPLEVPLILWKQ
jgi:starch phosphorylase